MRTVRCIIAAFFILTIINPTSQIASAQDTGERRSIYDDSGIIVSVSSFKVPWARVDSLLQLNKIRNAVTEKGREMGCYLDRQFLIHHIGDEYNVVYKTYRSGLHWPNPNPGRGNRAFQAVVTDSTQRAAIVAGRNWVFGGRS